MSANEMNVLLVQGAWADGSSWNKVIIGLRSGGIKAVTVPLPLTTLGEDVAAAVVLREGATASERPHAAVRKVEPSCASVRRDEDGGRAERGCGQRDSNRASLVVAQRCASCHSVPWRMTA